MVEIFLDENLNANIIIGSAKFLKSLFNFKFTLIECNEEKLEKGNIIITDRQMSYNSYVIYPLDSYGHEFKISTHNLCQKTVEIDNGLVHFKHGSNLYGMSLEINVPINEYIVTSDLGLATKLKGFKYYKIQNLATGAADLLKGQDISERLFNLKK